MKVIKPNTIAYPDGSFSRGTIGTYFDAAGIIQTAGIDVPRFTYNPTTLAFEGLLIEPASTNLLLYSAQFDNAAWVPFGAKNIVANSTVAPDGTATADTLSDVSSVAFQGITQSTTVSTGTQAYTASCYVRKTTGGTSATFGLNFGISGGTSVAVNARFNTDTGITIGGSGIVQDCGIYWRFSCSVTNNNTAGNTSLSLGIFPSTGTYNSGSDVVTATGSVILWGAQVEAGTKATSYIATTSASVPRNTDVITGTGLIYTTATDPNPLYSSGTTYALDAVVRYNGVIYQSLQASNTNHQPDISPTWWIELYADNMHAAFDIQTSTISSAITSMTFVVKPGSFDSAALINLETALVQIAVSDDNTKQLVYNSSAGLADSTLQDWYQYFFYDPLVHRTQVVFYNIPPYTEAVVTIRLSGSALSIISIAQAIFGTIASLGGTQYGAQAGIVDYSRKDTDEFGTISFTKRAFSKRLTADIYINNAELNRIQNYLYNIRATPTVWIASDDPQLEEVSIIWGFYRDFSTTISYPSHSLCNLQIEGLT